MATNKELVEQAVGAIPKWMAFLDRKQEEQKIILSQMQDDEAEFAPKTLTQKLADRFKSNTGQPEPEEPAETKIKDDSTQVEQQVRQDQVKLEKEENKKEEGVVEEEEEAAKETPVPQEPDTDESNEPVSSDDDQQMLIDKKNFNDLF